MKPTKFKQQNITYAKDQPEYQPLPALKIPNDPQGEVISCWKMSIRERLRVLITGRIWVSLLSFNQPLTPSYLTTKRDELFTTEND
ncbi:MAG: hypothetical protein ACOCYO_03935 [Bacteroidota bacterium]